MTYLRRSLIIVLGLLVCGVTTYYFLFVKNVNNMPPPVLGPIQDFSLIDSNNQSFTKANLDGKVWVADLIFTSCEMTCPMMTKKMRTISQHFKNHPDLRFVSISVDPEKDTPAVLKKYAKTHGALQASWFFLTGDMAVIRELAIQSFKLATTEAPSLHSNRFVLVDKNSHVRGYYDPEDSAQMRKLLNDVKIVLAETATQ